MLPVETPIIVSKDGLTPHPAPSLDFDAYYIKPAILTQKVFDQLNPEAPPTASEDGKTSNPQSFRQSISPSHNFIKKKGKNKKIDQQLVQSQNKMRLPTIGDVGGNPSPRKGNVSCPQTEENNNFT